VCGIALVAYAGAGAAGPEVAGEGEALLPIRAGRWVLHVLEVPKRITLETDETLGTAREFALPVYVYLPETGAIEARLGTLERIVARIAGGAAESEWRPEWERWQLEGEAEAAIRRARPVRGEGGR